MTHQYGSMSIGGDSPGPQLHRPLSPVAVLLQMVAASALFAAPPSACSQQSHGYAWSVFTCESEFPLADPDGLGSDLEAGRAALAAATGLELSEGPIHISLFATRRRYNALVSQETDDARRQRGVFLIRDGQARIYSFQQSNLAATLRHEATHALLHSALPYVPLWLDEGLATYFEAAPSQQGPRDPHLKRLRWLLRAGWRPSLAPLESRKHSSELDAGDYRHAWAWVHFLLNESNQSRSLLRRYLGRIADGEPPQTLSAFLATEMPDADMRCARFLSRP